MSNKFSFNQNFLLKNQNYNRILAIKFNEGKFHLNLFLREIIFNIFIIRK